MNSDAGADEGIQSALLMSLDHQNRGRGRISDKHETWYQDAMAWCQLLLPFLLRMGVTTQEEFDHIYQQIGVEMQEPEFRGLFFLLSARGEKPEG